MRLMRNFLFSTAFAAAIFFLFCGAARAQGAVDYRFLEVVDYAEKPIADATVKVEGRCVAGELKTDEKGQLEKGLPIGFGDCGTRTFTVSKAGYYPFTDYFEIANSWRKPIKIELLIIPRSKAERRAVGQEQFKREFFVAARNGDIEAVRRFLKAGLSADLTTSELRGVPVEKNIPIFVFAAKSGDSETIGEFLSAGARVDKSPAVLATYLSASPFTRRVYRNEIERKQLLEAFENGAQQLIKAGASVNPPLSVQTTPLIVAAQRGYLRTARLLIEKGASVDVGDYSGGTALTAAITYLEDSKTRLEIADLLLKSGADVNLAMRYGDGCRTALMLAAWNADAETVKFLLARGADVNIACANGETALKLMKNRGVWDKNEKIREIVELLESAGAK